jgi:hypothetical protein
MEKLEPQYYFTYQIRSRGDGNQTLYHLHTTCNVLNVDVSNWKNTDNISCRMGIYYDPTGVSDWVYLNHEFSNPLDKSKKPWKCTDLFSSNDFLNPIEDDKSHCILDGNTSAEIDDNNIGNFRATFIRPYGTSDTTG